VLADAVRGLLAKRWSPEQVAHELRVLFAGQPLRWLCKESIYQAIYDPAVELTRPARRRRRRRRLLGLQRRGRLTAMRMIDERPAEVEDRLQAGHWEGDLIMGAGNRSAIGTLVERNTRFLILLPFTEGVASTEGVRHAITAALAELPAGLRRTLTWDQGKELALHPQITAATGTNVFFCDAHSPWQRGSNENMNGLLRDYFPKGTDLSVHTTEDAVRVAAEVNDRATQDARLAAPSGAVRRRDRGRVTGSTRAAHARGGSTPARPSPPSNPARVSEPPAPLRRNRDRGHVRPRAMRPARLLHADARSSYDHSVHLLRH
jgi:IS30 family transposase